MNDEKRRRPTWASGVSLSANSHGFLQHWYLDNLNIIQTLIDVLDLSGEPTLHASHILPNSQYTVLQSSDLSKYDMMLPLHVLQHRPQRDLGRRFFLDRHEQRRSYPSVSHLQLTECADTKEPQCEDVRFSSVR